MLQFDAGAIAFAESLHRHAWFEICDLDVAVISRTGGRQACKFSALALNSAYGISLNFLIWEMGQAKRR